MKILVTGMTASQCRENDSMAGNIATGLRAAGHEVEVARPSLDNVFEEDSIKWDHAFVGLGPLHGIGTAHMYGALGVIGQYWPRGVTFYLDDVDSGKIGSGFRIMRKNPWKLTKPFYGYKLGHALASTPYVHEWLMNVICAVLDGGDSTYPQTLIPSFTFDNAFKIGARICQPLAERAQIIDFSSLMPTLKDMLKPFNEKYGSNHETPGGPWWAVEGAPGSKQVRSMGPYAWPVVEVTKHELPTLAASAGYLAPTAHWSPRFIQMTAAGIPLVSPWQVFSEHIGTSFEHLATEIETMTKRRRTYLARKQYKELVNVIPSELDLTKQLSSLVSRKDPA